MPIDGSSLARQGPSDLAIHFAADVHELIRIGMIADKGGSVGLASGVGFGAGAAFGGHWAAALAGLAVGIIVKAAADKHKQTKFEQMHAKWQGILGGLRPHQLEAFVEEVATYYPAITGALRPDVLGTGSSHRALGHR